MERPTGLRRPAVELTPIETYARKIKTHRHEREDPLERPKGFMLLTEDAKTHEDMPTENHRHKCDDPLERLKGFSWLALETIPHGDIHPESLGANARTH